MSNEILGSASYGMFENPSEASYIKTLTDEEQKDYIKKLWLEDSKAYYEWKEDCIEYSDLPDLFGTSDNHILIDESKL